MVKHTQTIRRQIKIKTSERHQTPERSGAFIVNFEDISLLFVVFLLLNLNKCWLGSECKEIKKFLFSLESS